jgi:hypothetical protein
MTRISSSWTWFYKRALPAFWLVILVMWTIIMIGIGPSDNGIVRGGPMMIVLPIATALVMAVIARKIIWSCADDVVDRGDSLLVRRGGREAEIPFTDIESVRSAALMKPPRITLRLRRRSALGDEVTFIPGRDTRYTTFGRSQLTIELSRRAEQAREIADH